MRLTVGVGPLIAALAARAGAAPVVEEVRSVPWASITFSGARHRLRLRFDGAAGARRLAAMADGLDHAEFELGRHLLVDIAVVERCADEAGASAVVEALTVESD